MFAKLLHPRGVGGEVGDNGVPVAIGFHALLITGLDDVVLVLDSAGRVDFKLIIIGPEFRQTLRPRI